MAVPNLPRKVTDQMTAFLLGLLALGIGVLMMRKAVDVKPAALARGLKMGSEIGRAHV